MTVLVTGATGFIGSHVSATLLNRGVSVRALSRPGSDRSRLEDIARQVCWVELDLLTASSADLARAAEGVDAAILSAWRVVPGEYLVSSTNPLFASATVRLIRALVDAGCVSIVGLGTCFEYAVQTTPLDESAPLAPATPYASAKAETWRRGHEIASAVGASFAWARLFYLYGPFEDPRRLVPDVVSKLLRGQRAAVTEGRQLRDFLHVTDVAAALVSISAARLSGPVNVGSGVAVTVREVVNTIGTLTGRSDLIDFGARPENLVDPPFMCADVGRLLSSTAWRPAVDLRSGLEQTIRWWKEHI